MLHRKSTLARAAIAAVCVMGCAVPAFSGTLNLAPEPLGTSTSATQPNVMFILDDSGSMAWDYMPNYVDDNQSTSGTPPSSTASCFDSGDDDSGAITGRADACELGDPPYMSPDFNNIYYNPDVRYQPGVNADGTDMTPQNSGNTSAFRQVLNNAYTGGGATTDLTADYPDRVWCTATSEAAGGGNCRQNTAYRYPDYQFKYGLDTSGDTKYVYGAPYYYRMQTAQWCDSAARTNCRSGSAATAGTYTFIAPEFCTDAELKTCAAGAAVTAAHIYSGPRWCSDAGTLLTCQRKKIGNFVYPKHLGVTVSQTGVSFPAVSNEGNILVTSVHASGGTISSIQIGGVTVTGAPIVVAGGTPTTAVASAIASAIQSYASSPEYDAIALGDNVVVTRLPPGATGAGLAIQVIGTQIGTTSARGRLTINASGSSGSTATITAVTVNGVNLLCSTAMAPGPTTFGSTTVNASGSLSGSGGLNSNSERNNMRDAIADRVTRCAAAGALNNGFATSTGSTGSGGSINYYVNLIAPVAQGSTPNGQAVAATGTNIPNLAYANMSGGVSSPAIATTPSAMAGGADAFSGTRDVRIGRGQFGRVDIVPTNNIYPKAAGRIDCSGANCTYEEEMTNFSNWYAYYRTRMQMMKTAAGRAFVSLDDSFRIGFITINPGSPVSSSKYLRVDDFRPGAGNHKEAWFQKLYSIDTINSTPLREALSRVGWIFAGQLDTGLTTGIPTTDDPMTASCQANFAILSTDGYWNGNQGRKLDNTGMDTQDSNPVVTPRPFYDGGTSTIVDTTTTTTYFYGGVNQQGCTSGRNRIMNTIDTVTRTRQYDASGTLTSDVTLTDSDTSNYSSCQTTPPALPTPNPSVVTTSVNTAGGGGSTGSLADVAMYYYMNDLRTSGPFSDNNVPITEKDNASHQHMTTFTIGLGLDGELTYASNYESGGSQDYENIKAGSGSPKDWPAAASDSPSALDDLWHAAVNGRGIFFSAKNPVELANGLTETLNQLTVRVGAGAAAATSNLQPVAGDNFAFTAQYQTGDWIGDIKARTIDLSSGLVSSVQLWSAASILDANPYTARRIYTFDPADTAGNLMKSFCWPGETGADCADGTGLTAAEQAHFNPNLLIQFGSWTATQQANATGERLVRYLRGETAYQDTGALLDTDLFRERLSLLGDIVNAQPSYVKKSPFSYSDPGYLAFRACTEGSGTGCPSVQFPNPTVARRGTVFAAANDGMLHAFETDVNNNPYYQTSGIGTAMTADDAFTGNNAGNGTERWAYIPGIILSKMYRLANKPYAHSYLTDGSPVVGDICVSTPCAGVNDWRTILVAGVNGGGMGYYALDITNPLAPKVLWEFTNQGTCQSAASISAGTAFDDCHVGLSYGNPIVTKRHSDGKWVVIVTSGYNNTVSGGDGKGYLYILEAETGKILHRLTTGAGSAGSPSGLGKINGWTLNSDIDNTVLAVYGGDLDGNLWRFQLDSNAGSPAGSAYLSTTLVAVAKDSSGVRQPITVKPELGEYQGKRIVMFGTGLFLQDTDKNPPFQTQTIYALRDEPTVHTSPVVADVRDAADVRPRTLAVGGAPDTRTVLPGTAPTWATEHGWLIDLPDPGERVNVDPQLQLGTLVVASNVPSETSCTAGGFSYINFIDYITGSFIPGAASNMASLKIASSLAVGLNVIMLPGGAVKTIVTTASNQQLSQDTPLPPTNFTGRRVSWRELIVDR